ncbi:MAG: precorrin-6A reductase, partial [Clostridiales bacterium]|nr:precorrin-6A reductase [Clostridiales bacterium]
MCKLCVFAGTTEGRELTDFLCDQGVRVTACVATEYGGALLTPRENLTISAKRLTDREMEELFTREHFDRVIDATHPYASAVTENIAAACERTGTPYLRLSRRGAEKAEEGVFVPDIAGAVEYLNGTQGPILLTTGSKELAKYTGLADFSNRVYARVLPMEDSLALCREAGLKPAHILAMQGPFTREMNVAMLRSLGAKFLVTKDSGKAGGFLEKIQAAEACGATVVIIGRPLVEEGLSLRECRHMLIERYGLTGKQKVTLLGIGMGSPKTLTLSGQEAVRNADLIVGAKRMADAVRFVGQDFLYEYRSKEISEYLKAHPEYTKVVVALSGDVGFYSGAKKLVELLGPETEMICGISSVVYFMSKIGLSWDDAKIVSAHGKACNLISLIRTNRKVFSILGTGDGVRQLAEKLTFYGMGDVVLHVGENLSYDNEKILAKPARELVSYEGDPLSVICAYNPGAELELATHGLPDEEFIRGKAPMT